MPEHCDWLSDDDLATWLDIRDGNLCKIARSHTIVATKEHEHVQFPAVPVLHWGAADRLVDTHRLQKNVSGKFSAPQTAAGLRPLFY